MARFIMAGQFQAFIYIVLTSILAMFMPPISLLSNAAIGLVTLRNGWKTGLLLALAGATALSLFTFIIERNLNGGFTLGLLQWGPIVGIASILHRSVSWKPTLQTVFILAASGILIFHALIPDSTVFWSELLLKSGIQELLVKSNPELNVEDWIKSIATGMTGVLAIVMCFIWSLSLLLARYWQAQLYNPGGFGEEFRSIRLGKTSAIIVLSLVVLAVVTRQQPIIELMSCGVVIFMIQGVSLAHAMAKHFKLHRIVLVMLYALLLLVTKPIALLLVAVGIIDSFTDFREKLFKK